MSGDQPQKPPRDSPSGRLASFPERSATSTTIASLVGATDAYEARDPSASRKQKPSPQEPRATSPFPFGAPYVPTSVPAPHSRVNVGGAAGTEVAESHVYDAYRASSTLQCAALADCAIVALSVLTILTYWSPLCLILLPFGIIGRMAAISYKDGWMLKTYMGYCVGVCVLRLALAILFTIWGDFFDVLVEVLKIVFQVWFFVIAHKFRQSLAHLRSEERERLAQGRVAVARQEYLVYV